jgi:DMSO/TMAO reductase YedYZ molybdopterin-dependent catalytic subunit
MRELPPGQAETRQFPVVGETQSRLPTLASDWRLTVEGDVAAPLQLTLADVLAMPQSDLVMDVHCVTGWTRFETTFTGVPLSDLFQLARPQPSAKFVQFIAWSERNHDTSLPLDSAWQDCWLAHQLQGQPLTPEHGGPLRVVTRGRYFYKSLKWIRRIILLPADIPGYWERESAYHNNADPWLEQRYDDARLASHEETARFRELTNFDAHRGGRAQHILIKANLSNWSPKSSDLRGLQLKACTFDGADLRGVDFRGANLTLCKFFRADLSSADFTGADLEGADFSGAVSLNDARFVDASLAAARFCMVKQDGSLRGPKDLHGMVLQRAKGLLEEQEQYLRERGIVNVS